MKNKDLKSTLLLIMSAVILLNSCDIVDPPYLQEGGTVIQNERKILLEDYTGHTCPNCPLAAAELKKLDTKYPGKIIAIAPHVSSLAAPHPGIWTYDFRTTCGTEWDTQFGISNTGLPKGMINRIGYPASNSMLFTTWGDTVASVLSRPADAVIEITNTYNSSTNTVETTISSKFVNALDGKYFLSVVYTEDSIIRPQSMPASNPIPTDTFYVHMHALRDDINGTWGELIATDPSENFTVSKTYSKQLKADAVPENCRVVAFIYKEGTYEVVQADEKHVK